MSVRCRLADGYPLDDPVLAAHIAELNKQGGVLMFCAAPDLQALRQAHLADSACVPPHA